MNRSKLAMPGRLLFCSLILTTGFASDDPYDVDLDYLEVPTIAQKSGNWCYAACAQMVVSYFSPERVADDNFQCTVADQSDLSSQPCCTDPAGSCLSSGDAKFALQLAQLTAKADELLDFEDLQNQLSRFSDSELLGSPVISRWFLQTDGEWNLVHNIVVRGTIEDGGGQYVLVNDPNPAALYSASGTSPDDYFENWGDFWVYHYDTFDDSPSRTRHPTEDVGAAFDIYDIQPVSGGL